MGGQIAATGLTSVAEASPPSQPDADTAAYSASGAEAVATVTGVGPQHGLARSAAVAVAQEAATSQILTVVGDANGAASDGDAVAAVDGVAANSAVDHYCPVRTRPQVHSPLSMRSTGWPFSTKKNGWNSVRANIPQALRHVAAELRSTRMEQCSASGSGLAVRQGRGLGVASIGYEALERRQAAVDSPERVSPRAPGCLCRLVRRQSEPARRTERAGRPSGPAERNTTGPDCGPSAGLIAVHLPVYQRAPAREPGEEQYHWCLPGRLARACASRLVSARPALVLSARPARECQPRGRRSAQPLEVNTVPGMCEH